VGGYSARAHRKVGALFYLGVKVDCGYTGLSQLKWSMKMSSLSSIIDRRMSKGKSAENRKKFLDRVRESVREAMPSILNKGSLKDIAKDGGEVEIKKRTISEPNFRFGKGGDNEHILPGNKEFVVGDKLKKPQGGQGKGGPGAGKGDSEDPFVVQISREEFLNYLFEDLELPDLVRKELSEVTETRRRNAGYSTTGTPAKLSIPRSMKMAFQRRLALRGSALLDIEEAEERLQEDGLDEAERALIVEEIELIRSKNTKVPFIDTMDMRFRSVVLEERPITSATMVCIMDNSGSMGQREKTLARKFFYLLYMFLNRKYEKIELVFIHHTDSSKEVTEEEFFNTRESGGTMVSSALELLKGMIPGRVDPSKTNVYVCQCSDGDNYSTDNAKCVTLLSDDLLKKVQYWAYIQIERDNFPMGVEDDDDGRADTLWRTYREVGSTWHNLAQKHVAGDADIYPVFRKLFEKKVHAKSKGV
jgi:uncharacterized sporulation protein YeaH/YhbH (DUF444 family)